MKLRKKGKENTKKMNGGRKNLESKKEKLDKKKKKKKEEEGVRGMNERGGKEWNGSTKLKKREEIERGKEDEDR